MRGIWEGCVHWVSSFDVLLATTAGRIFRSTLPFFCPSSFRRLCAVPGFIPPQARWTMRQSSTSKTDCVQTCSECLFSGLEHYWLQHCSATHKPASISSHMRPLSPIIKNIYGMWWEIKLNLNWLNSNWNQITWYTCNIYQYLLRTSPSPHEDIQDNLIIVADKNSELDLIVY